MLASPRAPSVPTDTLICTWHMVYVSMYLHLLIMYWLIYCTHAHASTDPMYHALRCLDSAEHGALDRRRPPKAGVSVSFALSSLLFPSFRTPFCSYPLYSSPVSHLISPFFFITASRYACGTLLCCLSYSSKSGQSVLSHVRDEAADDSLGGRKPSRVFMAWRGMPRRWYGTARHSIAR